MTYESIRKCMVSGCGRQTTYYRRHCTTVHDMSEYIYRFFLVLVQAWKTEIRYNTNDDYVYFFKAFDDRLLLKLRLPPEKKRRPRKSPATKTGFYRGHTSSSEISELAATTSTATVPEKQDSFTPRKIRYNPSSVRGRLQQAGLYNMVSETIPELYEFRRFLAQKDAERIKAKTSTVPAIKDSFTPREMLYYPSSVRGRLQEAGLYKLAPETLPEISGFRKSLQQAVGDRLTAKTIQLYNNARKLYEYLRSQNPSDIFSEENISSVVDTLIRCGVRYDSLTIWLRALSRFVAYLFDTGFQPENIKTVVTNICNRYNCQENLTRRARTIKRRRQEK